MKLVNLRNDETYHFFTWITQEAHAQDADLIVEQALKQAGQDTEDEPSFGDVADIVADKLAIYWIEKMNIAGIDLVEDVDLPGEVDDTPDSLWRPLLGLAARNIDFHAAAEALLVRAGAEKVPEALFSGEKK